MIRMIKHIKNKGIEYVKEHWCGCLLLLNIIFILFAGIGQYLIKQPTVVVNDIAQWDGSIRIESGELKKGVYDYTVIYNTNRDDVNIKLENKEGVLLADEFTLNPNQDRINAQLWLNDNASNIEFVISSDKGEENLSDITCSELILSRKNVGSAAYGMMKILFWLVMGDCIIISFMQTKRWNISRNVWLGLFIIVLVGFWGILNEGWRKRDDTAFHLARIWGLACEIKRGNIPVRVQSDLINGHGVAVSIFYGDILLYFPALLVILKVPLYIAYKVYVFTIHVGTVVLSYISFKKISKNAHIGLLCSAVYSLSIYRLCDIYFRDAVGEYTAMMFLPVIVWGMWNIMFENTNKEVYKSNWIILSLGMTGIIQSHILTCEMVVFFMIITCICNIKKVIERERFLELCKAAVGSVLLNLFFLVPFLDYAREDLIVFASDSYANIQQNGLRLSDLFRVWGSNSGVSQYGEAKVMAITIGLPVTIIAIISVYLLINNKVDENRRKLYFTIGMLVLSLWMSTNKFPYDTLQEIPLVGYLVGSIQFPFRFMSIVMIFATLLTCIVALDFRTNTTKKSFIIFVIMICGICACQGMEYIHYADSIKTSHFSKCDGGTWAELAVGGQYLYENTDISLAMKNNQIQGEIEDIRYEKDGSLLIHCYTNREMNIELPVFYYPDYQCKDINTGEKLAIAKGNNNDIDITIPAEYQGTLKISFKEPILWRGAEFVSIIMIVIYFIAVWKYRFQKSALQIEKEK